MICEPIRSKSPYMRTNRISLRSSMQTEKFQPEGERIMPEARFTEFTALSVDSRVGFSVFRHRIPMFIFLTYDIEIIILLFVISVIFVILRRVVRGGA